MAGRRLIAGWVAVLLIGGLFSPLIVAADEPQTVRGVVFHDRTGNGQREQDDPSISGVRVSNGIDVTMTDEQGRYDLPLHGDRIIFVCKPRGWIYPTDELNLPRFYYIHKPDGSPDEDFAHPGSSPTGPLPASVDFPLHEYDVPEAFRVVLLADPQVSSDEQLSYFARDIMSEMVGIDAAFGLTLGDIVSGGALEYFEPINRKQALAGIPWHNVIGNHDLNREADRNEHANETFERIYGPANHAFQYGDVHFILIDNNYYDGIRYRGRLTEDQLAFIKNYLDTVPADHRIVLASHIPIGGPYRGTRHDTEQLTEIMEMLSEFPRSNSFSGHTHINSIFHLGAAEGYAPDDPEARHTHHNLGTASGNWWRGPFDIRGIPTAEMYDGTPNGYGIATFERDGSDFGVRFKAAQRPKDYQMHIWASDRIQRSQLGGRKHAEVTVNVFNASPESEVKMRLSEQNEWSRMDHAVGVCPFFRKHYERVARAPMEGSMPYKLPQLSFHLFQAVLPPMPELNSGTYLLEIKAEDAYGRVHRDHRPVTVVDE